CSGQPSVTAPKDQRRQRAKCISCMDRRRIAARNRNFYLQKRKCYITQCRENRGLRKFSCCLMSLIHNSALFPLFLASYYHQTGFFKTSSFIIFNQSSCEF